MMRYGSVGLLAVVVGFVVFASPISAQPIVTDNAPPPAYDLARLQLWSGEVEAAVELLNETIETLDRRTTRHRLGEIALQTLLGDAQRQRGDLAAALQAYERALSIAAQTGGMLALIPWPEMAPPRPPNRPNRPNPLNRPIPRDVIVAPPPSPKFLWPTARQVPLANLRVLVMVGAPSGEWFMPGDPNDNADMDIHQVIGLNVGETLRQLAAAGLKRRELLGRDLAMRSDLGLSVLETTEVPTNLHPAGVGPSFMALAMRECLRFHAGDSVDPNVVASTSMAAGGTHPVAPILWLANLNSQLVSARAQTVIVHGGGRLADGQRLPDENDLASWLKTAREIADVAAAHQQCEWVVEAMRRGDDVLADATKLRRPVSTEIIQMSSKWSRDAAMMASALSEVALVPSLELKLIAAQAALRGGDLTMTARLLHEVESTISQRRLRLPMVEADCNWLRCHMVTESLAVEGQSAGPREIERQGALLAIRSMAGRIEHPVRLRVQRLADQLAMGEDAAMVERLYQKVLHEPSWCVELDTMAQVYFMLDERKTIEQFGVRLGDQLRREDLVLRSIDDSFARTARTGSDRLPSLLDWREAVCQTRVQKSDGRDFFASDSVARDTLVLLANQFQIDSKAPENTAEVQRIKLEHRIAAVSTSALGLRRIIPPQPASQSLHPSVQEVILPKMPTGSGMVVFYQLDQRLFVALRSPEGATHWSVATADAARTIERWHSAMSSDYSTDVEQQQATADLRRTLFPPLCGIDDVPVDRWIFVPDGLLWQVPFERLLGADDRFRDIRYAATVGHAFKLAMAMDNGDSSDRGVLVWEADSSLDSVGNPVWWGQAASNLIVLPQGTSLPSDRIRLRNRKQENSQPATVPEWSAPIAASNVPRLDGVIDLSSSRWHSQSRGDEAFLRHVCNLHAGGVRNVLMMRWPVPEAVLEQITSELSLDLAGASLEDAWQRMIAILSRQEFSMPGLQRASRERTVEGSHYLIEGAFVLVQTAPDRRDQKN